MHAISLWQPWASLIAVEAKPYETRDWPPPAWLVGKRIAIHAAKHVDADAVTLAMECCLGERGPDLVDKLRPHTYRRGNESLGKFGVARLPVGCVVATAVLDAAFLCGEPAEGTRFPAATVIRRMESRPYPPCFTVRYDDYGNYAPGRWAWSLTDIRQITPPAPAIGRQKVFSLDLPEIA